MSMCVKKTMRKIFVLFVLLSLVFAGCNSLNNDNSTIDKDFDGLIDEYDPDINSNTYSYSITDYEYSSLKADSDTFTIDYRNFNETEDNKFNKNIAKLALLLTFESRFPNSISILNDTYIGDSSSKSVLLTQIGASNIEMISINPDDYIEDKTDIHSFLVGHHKYSYKNKKYQIFFVIFPGTDGSTEQWTSNFDFGADTMAYYHGNAHTEWIHKNVAKGFDVTANRAIDKMNTYFKKYADNEYQMIVLVSGHSRGADLANLYGKYLCDNNIKNFTYCFAASNIATDIENNERYQSIINIENYEDVITKIAPYKIGFSKFGQTIVYEPNTLFCQTFKELYGADYQHIDIDAIIDMLDIILLSRSSLYEFEDFKEEEYKSYSTYDKALNEKNKILSYYQKGSEEYYHINISDIEIKDGKYGFYASCSKALILDAIIYLLGHNDYLTLLSKYVPLMGAYSNFISTFTSLMTSGLEFNDYANCHSQLSFLAFINNY